MRFPVFFLMLCLLSACGISDHFLGTHSKSTETFRNISSVLYGSVAVDSNNPVSKVEIESIDENRINMRREIKVSSDFQDVYSYKEAPDAFLVPNGNFYFQKLPQTTSNNFRVSATLSDGSNLYSFTNAKPVSHASVKFIVLYDWHGNTSVGYDLSGVGSSSYVTVNQFTNFAYLLGGSKSFSDYSRARYRLNETLNLPQCRVEAGLCSEHIKFLASGNRIKAIDGYFYINSNEFGECVGELSSFPSPCQEILSSVRRKRL